MKKSFFVLSAFCLALGCMAMPVDAARIPSFKANTHQDVITAEDVMNAGLLNVQEFSNTASGYSVEDGDVRSYVDEECIASHIAYSYNNVVFLYDIIPNVLTGNYVKGVKNGDSIIVDLPQTVFWNGVAGFNLVMLKSGESEVNVADIPAYVVDPDVSSVVFNIGSDGSIKADIPEGKALGLVYCGDGGWAGYAAYEISMDKFNEYPVELPDDYGAVPDFMYCNNGDYGYPLSWAPGWGQMFFQGLCEKVPDGWVKITEESDDNGTVLKMAQNQYIGKYAGRYVFVKAAKLSYDKYGQVSDAQFMPDDYEFEIIWDKANFLMTAKDPEVSVLFNSSLDRFDCVDIIRDFKLIHQDNYDGVPANPYGLRFEELYDTKGYGAFSFTVPAVTSDGWLLDSSDLHYVVYVDGEECSFDFEEDGIKEEIEVIPWDFNFGDIWSLDGARRKVTFPNEGISTLGVQSVYRHGGVETSSEIVSIDLKNSVGIVDAQKRVVSVKYYDLSGREVADPLSGIFVKRVVYEDGNITTSKIAVND